MSGGIDKRCCYSYTATPRTCRPPYVYHNFGRMMYLPLSILAHPSPYFFTGEGVKKCETLPHYSTLLVFESPSIRNEATHCYQSIWCSDDADLFFPNLVQFGGPPLMLKIWKYTPLKTNCEIVNNLADDCAISLKFYTLQSLNM